MRPKVDQRASQLSLPHVGISITERNRTTNINPMSSSYNTPCIKHKLIVSIYSNTETSRDVHPCAMVPRCPVSRCQSQNFDGLRRQVSRFQSPQRTLWPLSPQPSGRKRGGVISPQSVFFLKISPCAAECDRHFFKNCL